MNGGFRIDRDPNTGVISIGPLQEGPSGTEVPINGFNANTLGWVHTHTETPYPSTTDKQIARGVAKPFVGTPLYGHKSISYVLKVPGVLTLYNGANPKDSKGHDRVINAPPCPK